MNKPKRNLYHENSIQFDDLESTLEFILAQDWTNFNIIVISTPNLSLSVSGSFNEGIILMEDENIEKILNTISPHNNKELGEIIKAFFLEKNATSGLDFTFQIILEKSHSNQINEIDYQSWKEQYDKTRSVDKKVINKKIIVYSSFILILLSITLSLAYHWTYKDLRFTHSKTTQVMGTITHYESGIVHYNFTFNDSIINGSSWLPLPKSFAKGINRKTRTSNESINHRFFDLIEGVLIKVSIENPETNQARCYYNLIGDSLIYIPSR